MFAPSTGMNATYDIIAGVDFTPISELALMQAWTQASQRPDARLHVLHVVEDGAPLRTRGEVVQDRDAILERLPRALYDHTLQLCTGRTLPPLHHPLGVHVRFGDPKQQTLQLAADLDADLLVVGSHGKRGLSRLMGSVSSGLVKSGRLPVLVVRPKALDDMRTEEKLDPPCPDCLEARTASGGRRFWCDVHARDHADVHAHSSTQRVQMAKPAFDTQGGIATF